MNRVFLLGLMTGSLGLIGVTGGCGTAGYSATERDQRISRNQSYEGSQITDDFDHIFLLRPASTLTRWNVQQDTDDN